MNVTRKLSIRDVMRITDDGARDTAIMYEYPIKTDPSDGMLKTLYFPDKSDHAVEYPVPAMLDLESPNLLTATWWGFGAHNKYSLFTAHTFPPHLLCVIVWWCN